jgi:molybdopterin-binding protein
MKISARNTIPGKITRIERGAVNAEVTLEIAGGAEITSVITLASVERLGLTVGQTAFAVIKASDVMIGIDD